MNDAAIGSNAGGFRGDRDGDMEAHDLLPPALREALCASPWKFSSLDIGLQYVRRKREMGELLACASMLKRIERLESDLLVEKAWAWECDPGTKGELPHLAAEADYQRPDYGRPRRKVRERR